MTRYTWNPEGVQATLKLMREYREYQEEKEQAEQHYQEFMQAVREVEHKEKIAAAVDQIKARMIEDFAEDQKRCGSIRSLADVHDYVDANEYYDLLCMVNNENYTIEDFSEMAELLNEWLQKGGINPS